MSLDGFHRYFARADFWLSGGFDFKGNIVGSDTVFLESFLDDIYEFSLKLFNVERVFDADNDIVGGINK